MSYKIENNRLFAKITQTSPIWIVPREVWMEIGLPDLPENVGGIIEFRPAPASIDEAENNIDTKKSYKIKVVMPQKLEQMIGKPVGPPEFVGSGKTIRGDDFKIFKCSPTSTRKYPFYVMETSSGIKYYAPTYTIAKMIEHFHRVADREYTTFESMKKDMVEKSQCLDFKNPHNFCVFFNLLQTKNKVSFKENGDTSSIRKYKIVVNK